VFNYMFQDKERNLSIASGLEIKTRLTLVNWRYLSKSVMLYSESIDTEVLNRTKSLTVNFNVNDLDEEIWKYG